MRYVLGGLVMIILGMSLISCQSCKEQPGEVLLPVSVLPIKFPDGTAVKRAWREKDYVYREGYTDKNDCRISRTLVQEQDGLILMKMRGVTESCTGKGCSHCAFKGGGGCECKNSTNTCEHTITRNDAFLR